MNVGGIPAKINRHVFKALTQFMCTQNGANFAEIVEYVRTCNKNLKPVTNLRETIRKALENYQRLGIVQKDKYKNYKLPLGPRGGSKTIEKLMEKQSFQMDGPSLEPKASPAIFSKSTRRRKISDSSLEDKPGSLEQIQKKIRAQKTIERRGRPTNLPRAKRAMYASNFRPNGLDLPEELDLQVTTMRTKVRGAGRKKRKEIIYDPENVELEEPGRDDRDSGDENKIESHPSLPVDTGIVTGHTPQEPDQMDADIEDVLEKDADECARRSDESARRSDGTVSTSCGGGCGGARESIEPNTSNVLNQQHPQSTNDTNQLADNKARVFDSQYNTYLN